MEFLIGLAGIIGICGGVMLHKSIQHRSVLYLLQFAGVLAALLFLFEMNAMRGIAEAQARVALFEEFNTKYVCYPSNMTLKQLCSFTWYYGGNQTNTSISLRKG